jgi:hypothetical protein
MKKSILFVLSIITIPVILIAQMPEGAIAIYQLDNTATDISGNNYNGSLTSTSATTNRFSNSNSATAFTANSSVGTLPLELVTAVSDDFTVGFWFRTTMTASSHNQWYGGNALVDAEVCGGTTDWGTALIDGGKVSFGIGDPDITIKSTAAGYNDGNWHFVTATRNKTSGTIILYMNGVQVATSSGTTTSSLTAPNSIRLGSNPCAPTGVYTGDLDDIVLYNRVLSSSEVTTMYVHLSAVVLPLRWIFFTGELQGNQAKLQWQVEAVENNDRFEIEHSTDGRHFIKKGTLRDGDGTTTVPGKILYSFSDGGLATGLHFYRIRQVDKDGRYTLSKTVQLKVNFKIAGFYLRSNPVADQLLLVNGNQINVLRLQVADMSGRILLDRNMKSTDAVIRTDVGKLRHGYYLLKISSDSIDITIPWIKQ